MIDREAIEGLEYLISEDCTDTQSDYIEEIEHAISALKERVERGKGCEYCKADRDGFVKKIGAFALSYTAGEHKTYLYARSCKPREINYCPMCGRPLKGDTHE